MALDTYNSTVGKVLLRCPSAGLLLARDWVKNAFRSLSEQRLWSWLKREGQFLMPAAYTTGTVAVTNNSITVTGTGTVWVAGMVGRQFRIGVTTPIYTIATIASATSLTLDRVWGGTTATAQNYEIYQAYVTAPSDFLSFISVVDPNFNWQLYTHIQQEELNRWDPQRANSGTSYVVADYAYDTTSSPPLPRFEIWPHRKTQYVYPYLYWARATDLDDSGATLPRIIRGDLLLELALMEAASWPGPAIERPNPYHKEWLVRHHQTRAERLILEMERQDDEIYESDVQWASKLPFAPFLDADWIKSHDVGVF